MHVVIRQGDTRATALIDCQSDEAQEEEFLARAQALDDPSSVQAALTLLAALKQEDVKDIHMQIGTQNIFFFYAHGTCGMVVTRQFAADLEQKKVIHADLLPQEREHLDFIRYDFSISV